MGWLVRFHALVLLGVLIDIALVGIAERPREQKHKVAKLQPRAPGPKVAENDSSGVDSSDGESDASQRSDDEVERDVEVEDASEPCLEAEQQECEDWGKSGYGCIWKGAGWCYHKKSTRYKDHRPNLRDIYAHDGVQDQVYARKGKADNLRETPNAKGGHAQPLDGGGEYELNGSSESESVGGHMLASASVHNHQKEAAELKPGLDFEHPHYQNTKEVGIQVGRLVNDAANQVKDGLHPKADEAKYRSDIYHNTLHDFDHDLRAYKRGVSTFRQTAAKEHKVKTKNLRDELVKSPELMKEHHPDVQDFNAHLDRHVVK